MLFKNVWYAAELTLSCKPLLLRRAPNSFQYARIQCRNTFSRRRRPMSDANPLDFAHVDAGPLNSKTLLRPFLFTIGVTSASIAGCVIWEYENIRAHATSFMRKPSSWINAQQKKIVSQFKTEPGPIRKWWNSLRESEKVFYPILAANLLVFGAWRVRAFTPTMLKYFCSNPSGQAQCLPMVFSTFSHYSTLHLAANMYVLYTFMPAAVASLGKEQFVALYLSGGVISSFTSFLYKVMLNQPGLSLGASGAIMSVLSFVCVTYPDTKLSIIFLPMYTFAAGTAIKFIMGLDLAGITLGWKLFDHAAHLGGALFGIAWCYWGSLNIWGNRDKFLQYYHHIRKESK
ncbi:presenilins-associated rhomboid-like protein, mitochondrial [Aricia agestis]|uniref:presenilins-associated rhomboid-like protein, mitochondrial n=1 Tax=Aricia agestis TaxID=91739 RepID=UPI001C2015AA|nr:presenilins-associated rhomboid-like protein, mitochondrial [Aricia agestis]XP_041974482.1 presenilins-associated rhomboid-like protein, mitochondrial [Aricia agestis]